MPIGVEGLYRHYKGKMYVVIGEAKHSETLEEMIVYIALYGGEFGKNTMWVRPKKMFFEKVLVNRELIPRFEKIGK